MKFPYCNKYMQLGIIHGDRYDLKWIPKNKDKWSLLAPFIKGVKLVADYLDNNIECYLCNNCKKVIIHIPEQY